MIKGTEPVIKICGLRDPESIAVAVDAGATAIGLMIAPSRRQVSLSKAAELALTIADTDVDSVGVVVNLGAGELTSIRGKTEVDVIQLSGDESPELLSQVEGRFWKSLRFSAGTSEDEARRSIDPWVSGSRAVEAVLVDASVPGAFGGTGHRADWDLVARLAEVYPLILAGGLNPSNVAEAIAKTGSSGVDVSSGVEKDGAKNANLIRAFVHSARESFG